MNTSVNLQQYREWTDQALADAVRRCESIVPEHLLEILKSYLLGGGKRLRPTLLLLACGAFGGSPKDVVSAAAALEMYHNWTLIHDDIIDHDDFRRGKPTGHIIAKRCGANDFSLNDHDAEEYGVSASILAGDILQGMAAEALCSLENANPKVVLHLAGALSGWLGKYLIAGEQRDVEMSHLPFKDITEKMIRDMMAGKTSALIQFSLKAGTALGLNSLNDPRIEAMEHFGLLWGISFQLQDDLLGIFGNEATFGKPVGSDIREGKRTLLAVRTIQSLEGSNLKTFLNKYGQNNLSKQEIDDLRTIMKPAADNIRAEATELLDKALDILDKNMPDSPERNTLVSLTQSMVSRNV